MLSIQKSGDFSRFGGDDFLIRIPITDEEILEQEHMLNENRKDSPALYYV